ncbi:MAG: division/cell wall cluster transcriptional repressor MraZ [Gemmatimonadota bacterium]
MGGYLGSYLNQVDEKGRVTLPAAFRKGAEAGASFILIHAHRDALTLYPSDNWGEVEGRMRDLARRAPSKRHLLLSLTANAQEVTPDKQGRILIAERLRSHVGIKGEALLIGALDKIEIWDPTRFEREVDGADGDTGDIAGSLFV